MFLAINSRRCKMKKTTKLNTIQKSLSMAALLSISIPAISDTLSGKLIGYECANAGTTCPTDNLDPHIALEPDFVLQTGVNEFFFLPNVSRDTKVRYVLQDIEVEGSKSARYNSITVDEFRIKKDDGFKVIWSHDLNEKARNFFNDNIYGNR